MGKKKVTTIEKGFYDLIIYTIDKEFPVKYGAMSRGEKRKLINNLWCQLVDDYVKLVDTFEFGIAVSKASEMIIREGRKVLD